MALHVKLSPEAEAELQRQRRNSSIASLLIGVLLVSLLALIFYFIGITLFVKETEPFVAYADDSVEQEELEIEKVVTQVVKRTPSSSSSATSPVIASTNPNASFSVPEVEVEVETLSATFGASDGFGNGFGSGFGTGNGNGNGFSFFGQQGGGGDVVFVIDYSLSMQSKNKIGLLKNELKKTIETLPNGIKFELIFFAGPAWLGGSTVNNPKAKKKSVISDGRNQFVWNSRTSKPGDWAAQGDRQEPRLEAINDRTRKENLEAVANTPLVWGTDWGSPLEMVFSMRSKPDTIVFLTDGAFQPSGSNMNDFVERIGQKAIDNNIKINAISLLEPAARPAMERLAEMTGGEFGLINAKGERVDQENKGTTQHKGYNK